MSHSILLIQPGNKPETRTYSDYESIDERLYGVLSTYEEHLKRRKPHRRHIHYNSIQLFNYIDGLMDLSCFVHQKSMHMYAPYNKGWIKERIKVLLQSGAGVSC